MELFGFYRRHIKRFVYIAEPLQRLFHELQPSAQTTPTWIWQGLPDFAIRLLKEGLANAATLVHPSQDDSSYTLTPDASEVAMSGVLHAQHGNASVPLAFFSRRFNVDQKKVSTYERELFVLHEAIRHFLEVVLYHRTPTYVKSALPRLQARFVL